MKTTTLSRVKEAHRPGLSMAEIAAAIGVSRSTVAGIYHRNPELRTTHPLSMTPLSSGPTSARSKPLTSAAANDIERWQVFGKRVKTVWTEPPPVPAMTEPAPGRYTLMELPANACKWMCINWKFCGEPANGPYCTAHSRLVYILKGSKS